MKSNINKNDVRKALMSCGNANDAIKYISLLYPTWPDRLNKPKSLLPNHTASDAIKYAEEFSKYETAKTNYDSKTQFVQSEINILNNILEYYLMDVSGAYDLPTKTARKLWSQAWEDGHSNGYSEVYRYLVKYVELFEHLDKDSLKEI